jgi:DNA-binding HxlR family transcriptional regulator
VVIKSVDSQCRAFQLAIEVLGRPWNALILNVLQGGPLRFSELAGAARGPGDKVLSARLKELERCRLIDRLVDAGPPVRVSYQLTEGGRRFADVAAAIERWGRCLDGPAAPSKATKPARGRRAHTDRGSR